MGVVLLGPINILKLHFSLSLYIYFRVEFSGVKHVLAWLLIQWVFFYFRVYVMNI